MRRRGLLGSDANTTGEQSGEFGDDHGPEFWAPNDDDDMGGHEDMGFDQADAVPFNTQFINDDDTPELDDEDEDGGEGDLMVATQGQLRRTARIDIGHARKAKRVDVKRLKDTIWRELEDVTISVKEVRLCFLLHIRTLLTNPLAQLPAEPAYAHDDSTPAPPEALVPVIQGLRRAYPQDKMDEISTSFCFICLLHLANENGLRIQTPDAGAFDDGLMKRSQVGGLDKLRVFREIAA